ncbi:hypothetical protein INR49_028781 [Caranx melampygus]|nr:hypothetical protein INR49_028781 [Caranx melampygus]
MDLMAFAIVCACVYVWIDVFKMTLCSDCSFFALGLVVGQMRSWGLSDAARCFHHQRAEQARFCREAVAGSRPFKCSYCPYSASQKGNLKTHVLCVHRMPFDNTLYPDRRFKRSRTESDAPDKSPSDAVGSVTSNQPIVEADGGQGSEAAPFANKASSCHQDGSCARVEGEES